MQGYVTIAEPAEAEHVERRSRFLSLALPGADEHAAATVLDGRKARYWDASHHCYAYILRAGGVQRYSDDGEPSGTAGMPILEVLRRGGLSDVMVVVTRYFGGTLLGTGGLARAYTLGATLALDQARILRMRRCIVFFLELPYPFYGKVQNLLPEFSAAVLEEAFGETVRLTLRVEAEKLPAFEKKLSEMSAGKLAPVMLRDEFAPV